MSAILDRHPGVGPTHAVCICNTAWASILPPPPCPIHGRPDWINPSYLPRHLPTVVITSRTIRLVPTKPSTDALRPEDV